MRQAERRMMGINCAAIQDATEHNVTNWYVSVRMLLWQ